MNKKMTKLHRKGREQLIAAVDRFMALQDQYMTSNPEHFEGAKPADFLTWFQEWDEADD